MLEVGAMSNVGRGGGEEGRKRCGGHETARYGRRLAAVTAHRSTDEQPSIVRSTSIVYRYTAVGHPVRKPDYVYGLQ